MSKQDLYISLDIESDGPCPGVNSMLSLGAAAFTTDSTDPVSTWYGTFFPLVDAAPDTATMEWWETQPAAWAEVNRDREYALKSMPRFAEWCDDMREGYGRLIPAAWPASFDFAFTSWYLWKFVKRNPLGFSCMDIRSYMNGLARYPGYQGLPIKEGRRLTGHIDKTGLREHVAVDDAIEQGRQLVGLLQHAQRQAASRDQ